MRCLYVLVLFFLIHFSGYSQSEQLAESYFEQGEFEKALQTYQKLAEDNPGNPEFFFGMVSSYQQMEDYSSAEKLLLDKIGSSANLPALLVELGHNYELQKNKEKAELYYAEALSAIESRPNYAHSIARHFEKYSLLDQAIEAYETGMKLNPDTNFNLQLARLYGEQGEIEKMFSNYIELVEKNAAFLPSAYHSYSQFITEDPENEANVLFRQLLIKKSQKDQDIVFNEMLSWLFMQQKEFGKAFTQEKAVYRRSGDGLGRLMQLAVAAREEEPEAAVDVLDFIIEESRSEDVVLQAHQMKLFTQQELESQGKFGDLEDRYRELFKQYGDGLKTISLQIDYANLLAFKKGEIEEGIHVLKKLLEKDPPRFEEAAIKMALADILVLDEKFNQALVYYSQIQNLVKNNEIAQTARFKVAKTSYYKGDFEWAQTQLDVLKASTSQLIANDAMELSLLIRENSIEDSTHTALKLYAKADLLAFQEKEEQAIATLDTVLTRHKAEKIEDEALLMRARLYESVGDYSKAEENYLKLIEHHKNGILGDNAHFGLAELYALQLEDPEKAKEFYEKIIFNYVDSIYFVDARKKYRELRGDEVE